MRSESERDTHKQRANWGKMKLSLLFFIEYNVKKNKNRERKFPQGSYGTQKGVVFKLEVALPPPPSPGSFHAHKHSDSLWRW